MKNLILIGIVLSMFSCKSKSDDVEALKSTVEYLTGTGIKKWMVTAGKVKLGESEVDLINSQQACITDNLLVLNVNKSYELQEGKTKCPPATGPDIILKSTWSYLDDPKSITVDKFIFLDYIIEKPTFLIKSINDKEFIGETDIFFNNQNYKANITFSVVP